MTDLKFDKYEKKIYDNESELADVNVGYSADEYGLLTMKEAEKFLRIKRTSLYRLINSCELTTIKIGGRRFALKKDLDDFIKRKRAEVEPVGVWNG